MYYVFKKVAFALVSPFTVVVLLLAAGLVLLWWTRRQRAGKILVTAGVALLLLFALDPLPKAGLRALESRHAPHMPDTSRAVEWIVVLGGGARAVPGYALTDQLYEDTLRRVLEGLRLARAYPEARVLFSEGAAEGEPSGASMMGRTAEWLGLDPARVVLDEASRDTESQARFVRERVGEAPFLLVTSAFHMPRALALFEGQGLEPVPAPTSYRTPHELDAGSLLPSGGNVESAHLAWKEYLGMLWARLNGQV